MADIENLQRFVTKSGSNVGAYVKSNPIRPFSGGKAKFREYKEMVSEMELLINQSEEEFQIQSTCTKGCAACCNQIIVISQFEADMMWNYLDMNYDRDVVQQIKVKMNEVAAFLDSNFGKPPKNQFEIQRFLSKSDENKDKYFSFQLPCPLLNEDKECMVYPVRPSACWSYRVYGNPEDCKESFDIPHAAHFGHEEYFMIKKRISVQSGSLSKSHSYHMAGSLPQIMKEHMKR